MGEKVYGFEIASEKTSIFLEILKENPLIEETFGKEWIKNNIIDKFINRLLIHPLFWIILTDKDLVNKLEVLRKSYDKFRNMIKHLKNDVKSVRDIMMNITIFCEYQSRHKNVFFQPPILENKKECDVMVEVDGTEFWGEILTINLDRENSLQDEIDNYIRIHYNEKNRTKNGIFLNYQAFIDKDLADKLIDFSLEEAKKLSLKKDQEVTKEFIVNDELICKINFFGTGGKYSNGYYGGSMGQAHCYIDDIRIKNKILDKLDKFQFPTGKDIKRFFVIVIPRGGADMIDVDNALLGQECVTVTYSASEVLERREGRKQNGVIHDPERGKIFLDLIDFVVINKGEKKFYKISNKSSLELKFLEDNF